MNTSRSYWPLWMDFLHKRGLAELVAWVLEAAGPFNILGAQMLYLSQPLVTSSVGQSLGALANLLEQEDETGAFIARLNGKAC